MENLLIDKKLYPSSEVYKDNKPRYHYVRFGKSKEKANVSPIKKSPGRFAFIPKSGGGGIRTPVTSPSNGFQVFGFNRNLVELVGI